MLVFQTVTSEFAEFDKLCGIRLLDKSAQGKSGQFRVEVWLKSDNEHSPEGKNIKAYLTDKVEKILNEPPRIKYATHVGSH